jgi:hypothetical protein
VWRLRDGDEKWNAELTVQPEFAIEKRVHVDKLPVDNNVFDEHKTVLS